VPKVERRAGAQGGVGVRAIESSGDQLGLRRWASRVPAFEQVGGSRERGVEGGHSAQPRLDGAAKRRELGFAATAVGLHSQTSVGRPSHAEKPARATMSTQDPSKSGQSSVYTMGDAC
jgi:hypothetical protein